MSLEIPTLMGKEVLITGGNGFIGSNLAYRLVKSGAKVTLLNHSDSDRNIKEIKDKVEIIIGDIRDKETVEKAIKNKQYIFHFAGQTLDKLSMEQPQLDLDINCNGTLNILEACKKLNSKASIVFVGTVTEAGPQKELPVDENRKDFPVTIYDAHKLVCEHYLRIYHQMHGLKTTTLRLANVFGERQQVMSPQRGVLNHMLKRAMTGELITVYGEGDFIRDYCYIQNYLDAFILAATSSKTNGKAYILGSGKGITFLDMVTTLNETVNELTGKSTEIKKVPFPEEAKKIERGDFIADYSAFKRDTGWEPQISFEEGIKKTVLFYKERLQEYLE